jgi:hypothetical protein
MMVRWKLFIDATFCHGHKTSEFTLNHIKKENCKQKGQEVDKREQNSVVGKVKKMMELVAI